MKTLFLTTLAALTASVSAQIPYGSGSSGSGASPIPSVTSGTCAAPTQFSVSAFRASCIRHGTGCSFSFSIVTNETSTQSNTCTASFPSAAIELPAVPFTACTSNANLIWAWEPVGLANGTASNYTLLVADASLGLAAVKVWDAADWPMVDASSTMYQTYQGSTSFDF